MFAGELNIIGVVHNRDALAGSMLVIFEEYDATGAVTDDTVREFETAEHAMTTPFGPFTVEYFRLLSEEDTGSSAHARPALDLLSMHRDMLEAIEEAFGYVALDDPAEKDQCFIAMESFRSSAQAFSDGGCLNAGAHPEIATKFNAMMDAADAYEETVDALNRSIRPAARKDRRAAVLFFQRTLRGRIELPRGRTPHGLSRPAPYR